MTRFRKSKYGNTKREYDGYKFDSLREMRRYQELELLEKAGEIRNLKLQVPFILQDKFVDYSGKAQRAITYKADFVYEDKGRDWELVVEDCKGFRTPVYQIKKKMFLKRFKHIFIET